MTMFTHDTVADMIETTLVQYGEKPAFSCLGQTLSFSEVEQKSRALAAWLQAQPGLKAGDRVAIQLPNLNQFPIAAYAVLRAGMVVVNTNPLYTAREMLHQFNDSGAKALIILSDLLPKFDEIKTETAIRCVVATEAAELLTGVAPQLPGGVTSLTQALRDGESLTLAPRASANPDDLCVLQYTGGTTGVSKAAMLSNGNLLANVEQTAERLGDRLGEATETFVLPLPLYHIYAFLVGLMYISRGNLLVLIPNPRDVEAFVAAVKPFKFTGFSGINTLFVGLCQVPAFKALDFSELKFTISGGSTLTSAAAETWMEVTGCTVSEGYGLSETSPVLCLNAPGKEVIGSVGMPLADTDIRIWKEDGIEAAEGEEGEIVARGPQVMQGYWSRSDETAKVMSDGFFKTGDVGVRLPSGHIKIVDRLKDLIIVSGFNVYPNEVEELLTRHSTVIEAAVVGEPDDRTGEKVAAYITTTADYSEQSLIEHCQKNLTGYKVPRKIVVIDELPKSTVGKILRRELRVHREQSELQAAS